MYKMPYGNPEDGGAVQEGLWAIAWNSSHANLCIEHKPPSVNH